MHEELGDIHLVTKGAWDQERSETIKANQQKRLYWNQIFYEKLFLRKNISIPSKVPFLSLPSHMQIYVQNCVLSSLEIPGLLDHRFTNAEFQSSCSETGRSFASLAMPVFNWEY